MISRCILFVSISLILTAHVCAQDANTRRRGTLPEFSLHEDLILTPLVFYVKDKNAAAPFQANRDGQMAIARTSVLQRTISPSALNTREIVGLFSDEFLLQLARTVLQDVDMYTLTPPNYKFLQDTDAEKLVRHKYDPIDSMLRLLRGINYRNPKINLTPIVEPLTQLAGMDREVAIVRLQAISLFALETDRQDDHVKLRCWLDYSLRHSRIRELWDSDPTTYWARIATRDCAAAIVRVSTTRQPLVELRNWMRLNSNRHGWLPEDPVIVRTMKQAQYKLFITAPED
jgi:hypothetical protein